MANTLRIKRRASGSPGAPTSLANAELAFNEVDDVLYYGKGTGGAGGTATTTPAIAGAGAFLTLSTAQTVSGNKTFTGDVIVPTQATSDNSTKAASTAYVKAQGYLSSNQSITFSGDASGTGSTSVTLTLASVGTAGTYTKVTTDAKGRVTSGTTLGASDIPDISANYLSTAGGTLAGNLTVGGDLTVNGTLTSINSSTVTVDDINIELGSTASPTDATANGGGITLKGTTDKTIEWLNATGAWTFSEHVNIATGKVYRIGGTQVLSGSALGSGVTSSSLTSVGTLTSGTWQATTIAVAYGGTGATTLSGYVKGNGTSAMTASATIPSTDITGLGTMSTQNANNVAITGGTIDNITFDGGTF
jgi:hypothetical protein